MSASEQKRAIPTPTSTASAAIKPANRLILFITVLAGITITFGLYYLVRSLEREHAQAQFDQLVQAQAQSLQRNIDSTLEVVHQIAAFVRSSRSIEREEFRMFVEDALDRHPEIYSLQWRPHVTGSERGNFESRVRAEGFTDYIISDADTDGVLSPAPDRSDYYPLLYGEPLENVRRFLGLDQTRSPERQAVYMEALRSSALTVSSLIELYEPELHREDRKAWLIYLPVRPDLAQADFNSTPLGFAVAIIKVRNLVEYSLGSLADAHVHMTLSDLQAPEGNRELYRYLDTDIDQTGAPVNVPALESVIYLQLGNRTLSARFTAGEGYRPENIIYPRALLAAGLLLTIVACLYLRLSQQRVRQAQAFVLELGDEVRARTASEETLRASEARLQQQNIALMELTRHRVAAFQDLKQPFNLITETAARTLGAARVGIWLFNDTHTVIECADLYEAGIDQHTYDAVLSSSDYPSYFRAMLEQRTIAAHDAHSDPRTAEFSAGYLTRNGIGAMLDAPVHLDGNFIGVICHEHRGGARNWTLDEQSFAGSIADLVSLTLETWERKRAASALRENERKYRELVENANSIILRWSCDGTITFMNEFGLQFFGYSESELIGRHLVGTFVPETESTGRDLRPLMDLISNDPKAFEHNINENMRRNGERVWVAWTNKAIFDEHGKVREVLSIGSDITDRRLAEQSLRVSEARYRSLVLASAQIVWTCTPGGETVEPSPTWELFTGQTFEQYRGWGWAEAVHPEDRHRTGVNGVWKDTRPADGRFETEYRIRRHDGVYRLFRVRGNEVLDANGKVLEWVGTCHDITEIRAAEAALRQSHLDLERKVKERTAELASANERLKELDRLKSEFLATMSHELRTPLNSIIGFTGILRQGIAGPVTDEQRKQLGMVYNSATHLLGLINDLLDLSRIESGRMDIHAEQFSCADVIMEIMQQLTPLVSQKQIRLLADISDNLPVCIQDRKKVYQILLNLVNNSVKFTEQGEVKISATCQNDRLAISVKDTGIGIKPENMSLLFEAFRQIEGSARRRYEGTGLGLHLSLRLAQLLGGHISAESEFGHGSTFTLVLPLTTSAVAA